MLTKYRIPTILILKKKKKKKNYQRSNTTTARGRCRRQTSPPLNPAASPPGISLPPLSVSPSISLSGSPDLVGSHPWAGGGRAPSPDLAGGGPRAKPGHSPAEVALNPEVPSSFLLSSFCAETNGDKSQLQQTFASEG
jgi:hypothetical protein